MSVEKQPVTLDRIMVQGQVEELRKTIEQLAERLNRVETSLGVSETGLTLIYSALEAAGIMRDGEPAQGAKTEKEPIVAVKEETFTCLTFEDQQGAKLGQYAVAYKQSNLVDKWTSAYNILRQSNATIQSRYHGPDYQFSYWLYGEGKIYRQRLKAKP
jgi:hypothetical protein